MRSTFLAIAMLAAYLAAIAFAHAEPTGDLYAFCDSTWATQCNERVLMLKDVCDETLRTYTDGSKRFWCYRVDAASRDAYLSTLDPDVREKTFDAWREGR
jgi:hypothetical protein